MKSRLLRKLRKRAVKNVRAEIWGGGRYEIVKKGVYDDRELLYPIDRNNEMTPKIRWNSIKEVQEGLIMHRREYILDIIRYMRLEEINK